MPRTVRNFAIPVTIAGVVIAAGSIAAIPTFAADTLTIPTIQGSGHLSSYEGKEVTTTGVVTATKFDAYWLQDPHGDGDDTTSDAIYVYTGRSGAKPAVGQTVSVTGIVDEFRPADKNGPNLNLTELTKSTFTVLAEQLPAPAAVRIGPGGRQAPAQVADASTTRTDIETAEFDPSRDALDFYETLEGMLVEVRDAEVTGPANSYGEITVVPGGTTKLPRTVRGGVRYGSYKTPNTQRLTIDDEILRGLGSPPGDDSRQMPSANVGDVLTGSVTGPLTYDFGTVRVYPKSIPTVKDNGLRKEVTRAAGSDELAVATFNVENLDPKDVDAKFAALAGTIVANLRSPDVLALEEVQDNTGAECPNGPSKTCQADGVVDADQTLSKLVTAIAAAGGPTYQWRQISPQNLTDGGEPTGNIRQAFLYRTDRGLAFVDRAGGDATTPTAVVKTNGRAHLTLSPGRVAPAEEAWANSRKPLAGEFTVRGRTVIVIANHFNSKGGDEPLTGRWQPPTRSSEVQRNAQAALLQSFVARITALQPTANVVVAGDINDFEFSRTSVILTKDGALVDLPRTLPRSERYSYVFQGNSQVLDHILVSKWAYLWLRSYDIVHVNAEFADQMSDHDPQVIRFVVR